MSVIIIETVSGRIKKIQAELKVLDKDIVKALAQVSSDITKRTQSGLDYKGTSFASYSKQYKKAKERSGRPGSPVNLTYRGHMLNGKTVKRIADGGKIWFPDSKQRKKAGWHNTGAGTLPERHFFELSNNNVKYIETYLLRKIHKAVKD